MKKTPLVSIIMPVYNGQEYLNIALDSILLQTYKNFELIIIDDGSTDNSSTIIDQYTDKRIRYIYQKNHGLSATLNNGLGKAKGEYIARMDCDDISYPTRLALQVSFLEKHKSVALVGSSFDLIDQDGCVIDHSIHLGLPRDLRLEFLVRNPFGHGTVMVRSKVLQVTGAYDVNQPIEDYELWWRIAQHHPVANIAQSLYGWRINPTGISHGSDKKRQQLITKLMNAIWAESSVPNLTQAEIKSSIKHYAKQGPEYREQFIYFIAALAVAFRKKKRLLEALKLYRVLVLLAGGRAAYKDVKRNPRSHNYNLTNISSGL